MLKGVSHKFDVEKQLAFIHYYYVLNAFYTKDKTISFINAVHLTPETKFTSGWRFRRQEQALKTTGNRSSLNIVIVRNISDITSIIVSVYDTIDSISLLRSFCKLRGD